MANQITATNNWFDNIKKLHDEAAQKREERKREQEEKEKRLAELEREKNAIAFQETLEFLGIELSGQLGTDSLQLDDIKFTYKNSYAKGVDIEISIGGKYETVTINLGKDKESQQLVLFNVISTLREKQTTPAPKKADDPRLAQAKELDRQCRFIVTNYGKSGWDAPYEGYKDDHLHIKSNAYGTTVRLVKPDKAVFQYEHGNAEILRHGEWRNYLVNLYADLEYAHDLRIKEEQEQQEKERQEFEEKRFAPIEWELDRDAAIKAGKAAAQSVLNPPPSSDDELVKEVTPEPVYQTPGERLLEALTEYINTERYEY